MLSLVDPPSSAPRPLIDPSILAAARQDAAPSSAPSSAPASSPIAPAAGLDYAEAASTIVEFAAASFFPLWPSLAPVYPKETRDQIAAALGPVLRKYNIDLNALPPELVLAIVVLPTVPAAIAAIRADRIARGKAPAPAPAPTTPGVKPDAQNENGNSISKTPAPLDRFPGLARDRT